MENKRIGPFLIVQRLGNNRRQRVFHATQTEQQIDVALKFIGIPSHVERNRVLEKIQIEVEVLKKLNHPNLVKILGAGVDGEEIFFAMELVKGESLTSVLSRRGKFAADQVVDFGRQIARFLNYIHDQDIIHSKLTPDKILVEKDGSIKVSDLRLNRSRKRRWDSSRKRELDIAAYMAPEQFTEGATAKSDIYSLGVILYEMLTGKLPYEPDTLGRMARRKMQKPAPPISTYMMNCPTWLDKTVCQMISPDPKSRPHSAKTIVLAMKELKLIDKNRTAAIAQVSGGFNPLTAGTDRSEADRILEKPPRWSFDPEILRSTGAMIIAFIMVVGIMVFALWPESTEAKFARAEKLVASSEPSDWREARTILRAIIKSESEQFSAPAQELYYESRRLSLLAQAKRGKIMGLQSQNTQNFIKAFQLQQENKLDDAIIGYDAILSSVDQHGEEQFIYAEAKSRLSELRQQLQGQPPSANSNDSELKDSENKEFDPEAETPNTGDDS